MFHICDAFLISPHRYRFLFQLSNVYFLSYQTQTQAPAESSEEIRITFIAFTKLDDDHGHPIMLPPSLKPVSKSLWAAAQWQPACPSTYLPVSLFIQLRTNMRCRKQATARRISSLKYVTSGELVTNRASPSTLRAVVNWSTEWLDRVVGSRKRNSLPIHIFCQHVLSFATYDSWPLTCGMQAYAKLRGHEAERCTRSGWAIHSNDVHDYIASGVVDT